MKQKKLIIASVLVLLAGILTGCGTTNETQTLATETPQKVTYIDLSHRIEKGTVTYPGMPATEIKTLFDRETTAGWNGNLDVSSCELSDIKMVGINGTYIDAPFHVYPDGHTIADYPIEKLVDLPILVVNMAKDRNYFDVQDIKGLDVKGCAVLFNSGFDKYFGTDDYGKNPPYLTVELATALVEQGAALVGIDSPLVDDMTSSAKIGIPVHYKLLGADIPICEDMTNLSALPEEGAILYALPPAVEIESFAARVYAKVLEN